MALNLSNEDYIIVTSRNVVPYKANHNFNIFNAFSYEQNIKAPFVLGSWLIITNNNLEKYITHSGPVADILGNPDSCS